jgi:hypothetical protein
MVASRPCSVLRWDTLGHAGTSRDNCIHVRESDWRDQWAWGGSVRNPGRRRLPLPAGLTQPEREFFLELRRLTDVAGFTYRALEKRTSVFKPAADPCFYGKSQWGRWLNGQSMPPRNAVKRLAEVLDAEGIAAGHLLDLWSRTFASAPSEEAGQDDGQAVPPQLRPAVAPVNPQPTDCPG